ncbi:Mor transcription activator family protein [Variovorax sp. OK605]|uniref:Mor transcription activator family protein n=1 Tax=Variovorax sp. OK605 TaxID=1855317 RepID=UPI0008E44E74|nr:Mor transcription activator family protein [Variovorax sp. OK605]SFQ41465.1 Mor transcription activator family protein [Variovorax sp. OK605]
MVNNANRNDIVLDIIGRLQEALTAARGELTPELLKGVETSVRADWGGDRVFIAKRSGEGHNNRNSRIFRDYLAGERVKLLSRRYELSERQVLRIIKAPRPTSQ